MTLILEGDASTCDRCEAPAAYQLELELAVDADSSESDSVFLCGAHYTSHVQTVLAVCKTAMASKPDDDFLDGELKLRVWDVASDDDVGEWKLCAEHAMALWNLKGEP